MSRIGDSERRAAEAAVAWAAAEGWNPGIDDAERFLRADPEAFLATERGGEIAATVSCALYGERYAFIGLYIVRPELRGSGIGTELFERALDRAAGRAVGLDGVPAQQGSYERHGFDLAHRNVRWRARAVAAERPAGLAELASVPFDELIAYDAGVFGAERSHFLGAWIERPPGQALACVANGELAGYGVVRECGAGVKVGPLFADDPEIAELLLTGLVAATGPARDVFLDVPAANGPATELAEAWGTEPVFETARMYRNGRPPEDTARVFGVTTFEFG